MCEIACVSVISHNPITKKSKGSAHLPLSFFFFCGHRLLKGVQNKTMAASAASASNNEDVSNESRLKIVIATLNNEDMPTDEKIRIVTSMCDGMTVLKLDRVVGNTGSFVWGAPDVEVVLRGMFKTNTSVETLLLSRMPRGDSSWDTMSDMVMENSTLKHINSYPYRFKKHNMVKMADAIAQNSSLESFDLTFCDIGDEGMRAVANMLKQLVAEDAQGLCFQGVNKYDGCSCGCHEA